MKIGCIGTGAMGGAIMRAVCKKYDVNQIKITDKNTQMGKAFAKETGAVFVETNKEVLDCDFIFLAVKPQFLGDVFAEIGNAIPESAVVISMAAGIKIEKLQSWAPKARFIRMMPNVCAQIGQGMTAISYNSNITQTEADTAIEILSTAGRVEVVLEKLMDCVTAVGGSAPAFVFMHLPTAQFVAECLVPRLILMLHKLFMVLPEWLCKAVKPLPSLKIWFVHQQEQQLKV